MLAVFGHSFVHEHRSADDGKEGDLKEGIRGRQRQKRTKRNTHLYYLPSFIVHNELHVDIYNRKCNDSFRCFWTSPNRAVECVCVCLLGCKVNRSEANKPESGSDVPHSCDRLPRQIMCLHSRFVASHLPIRGSGSVFRGFLVFHFAPHIHGAMKCLIEKRICVVSVWLSSLDFKCGLKLCCAWRNAEPLVRAHRTQNAVNEHFSRSHARTGCWFVVANDKSVFAWRFVAPNDWLHTSNATTRISYFIDKLKYFVVFAH